MDQMEKEGVEFITNAHVGENISVDQLKQDYDAILLAGGACAPRDLPAPGRDLTGIYYAMDYLTLQNKQCEGDDEEVINAKDKHVVIIGGGDTGADCLGTANRHGAASVHQLEIMPKLPAGRSEDNPGLSGPESTGSHLPMKKVWSECIPYQLNNLLMMEMARLKSLSWSRLK